MSAITKVRGQIAHCKECGELAEAHETPINHEGPYCVGCIDEVTETEEQG